jgi:hypothetical protein
MVGFVGARSGLAGATGFFHREGAKSAKGISGLQRVAGNGLVLRHGDAARVVLIVVRIAHDFPPAAQRFV